MLSQNDSNIPLNREESIYFLGELLGESSSEFAILIANKAA